MPEEVLFAMFASVMRVSCAKLTCCDSIGGGATVAMFLGGTEGDCVFLCCSTAAWFTYGVCGIVGTGIRRGWCMYLRVRTVTVLCGVMSTV